MRGQTHSKAVSYTIVAIIMIISTTLIWMVTYTAYAANEPIRLGVKVWAPDFFSYLAQEKGFFDRNKVNVELTLVQDYHQLLNNYADGNYDGMIPVYSDLIYQNSNGVDSKVVYAIDFSNTGDVIIGKVNSSSNSNTTLADFKGKKISVQEIYGFSQLFVLKALEKVGLGEGDVEFATVSVQNVTQELEEGRIDAGHIYQPYTTEALKNGYQILFAAGSIPGTITDVLVFRSDVIQQRLQDIQAVIKSIIEALSYYETHKLESLKIMSSKSGISEQEIKNGFDSVTLPSLKENFVNVMNSKSNETVSLFSSGKYIAQFFVDRGQIGEYPDLSQIIASKFVNALYQGQ